MDGAHTFETDSALGGNVVWIPPTWAQTDMEKRDQFEIDMMRDHTGPISNKFHAVLTSAMMAPYDMSAEYLARLESLLDGLGEEMNFTVVSPSRLEPV